MIILKTTDILRFKVTSAETSTPIDFVSSFVDITSFAPGNLTGTSNSTNFVTLVGSPASGLRQVKFISIFNDDTTAKTVVLELYDGVNDRQILTITLQVDDTLYYTDGQGFKVVDVNGFTKVSTNITSLYTALTTNSYITWTYNQAAGTITGQPINDTTTQKVDDSENNKVHIRNYDNQGLIDLIRTMLFQLSLQGFVFEDEKLIYQLSQYQNGPTNTQIRK
jgi:hypothetical protein